MTVYLSPYNLPVLLLTSPFQETYSVTLTAGNTRSRVHVGKRPGADRLAEGVVDGLRQQFHFCEGEVVVEEVAALFLQEQRQFR